MVNPSPAPEPISQPAARPPLWRDWMARTLTPSAAAVGAAAVLMAGPAEAATDGETAYILNTFSFLVHGVLVMLMAAGFAMLEAGLVRTKNTATICLKNVSLYALAGILYYLVGYNLMYGVAEGGFLGRLAIWSADDSGALAGDFGSGYAAASDWFFQMVFVATAASIVSGALAERIRLWPFLLFVAVLTGIIYPIQGSWQWGGGWLAALGFKDFAGSTLVHSCGGWAALTGALILGARRGKYGANGAVHVMPGANLPLATLGTFILWFGWFGFNGGSQLALGSAADAIAISNIYINTNGAAAAGVLAAMAISQATYRKVDLTLALNGAIGAFVTATSGIVWMAIKFTIGIRATNEDEEAGLDRADLGLEAYPEFGRGSQTV